MYNQVVVGRESKRENREDEKLMNGERDQPN